MRRTPIFNIELSPGNKFSGLVKNIPTHKKVFRKFPEEIYEEYLKKKKLENLSLVLGTSLGK